MFGLGAPELLVILIIVLVLFGGKRLPELGRAFGKSLRELKKHSRTEKDEISSWITPKDGKEAPSPSPENSENGGDFIQDKMEEIPGVKEAREIKETASKIKAASRFFLMK